MKIKLLVFLFDYLLKGSTLLIVDDDGSLLVLFSSVTVEAMFCSLSLLLTHIVEISSKKRKKAVAFSSCFF